MNLHTFTGRAIDPLNPQPSDICIMDIAHALALTCRYNGHCAEFYSVAQHSFIISRVVPMKYALWGLLHDAAEAYIGDIIRPVKALEALAPFAALECVWMRAICAHFGLPEAMPSEVAIADTRILKDEMRALRLYPPTDSMKPLGVTVQPYWQPREAENFFMCRFDEVAV